MVKELTNALAVYDAREREIVGTEDDALKVYSEWVRAATRLRNNVGAALATYRHNKLTLAWMEREREQYPGRFDPPADAALVSHDATTEGS